MNDDLLSQDPADYDAGTLAAIEGIIDEERKKTREMLARDPNPGAILIGGTGGNDGLFNAIGE